MTLPSAPQSHHDLVPADLAEALEGLFVRGTPENTLRAYERDLSYITAWKQAACGSALAWPETEDVALKFLLEHARDILNDLLATCREDLRGLRGAAVLSLAWASGGRRRS